MAKRTRSSQRRFAAKLYREQHPTEVKTGRATALPQGNKVRRTIDPKRRAYNKKWYAEHGGYKKEYYQANAEKLKT